MSSEPRWQHGDRIVLRHRNRDGNVYVGRPLTVIEDGDAWLVAYLAHESEIAIPTLPDGRAIRDAPLEERWTLGRASVRGRWHSGDLVMLFPRAGAFSLWIFRDEERRLRGWYVNLEQPYTRGAHTVDTRDNVLDVWVPAEAAEPQWKDEDELEAAVVQGRVTAAEAVEIRAEGERVLTAKPWPTGWEDWRPPAAWGPLELPEGWDVA